MYLTHTYITKTKNKLSYQHTLIQFTFRGVCKNIQEFYYINLKLHIIESQKIFVTTGICFRPNLKNEIFHLKTKCVPEFENKTNEVDSTKTKTTNNEMSSKANGHIEMRKTKTNQKKRK